VREHREGRNRVYQLNPEPLRAVDSWLDQYRNFWKMNLNSLKTFVEAEHAKEISQHHIAKPKLQKEITNMKSLRIALSLSLLLAATAALAQTATQKSFDQLKTLTGSWEGKSADGKPVQVSFRDTAGGSALMSEILGHGPENMISMFTLDGPNRIVLTHYCSVGNQPRMAATASPDGKTFTFDYFDATNLKTPIPATCSAWFSLLSMPTITPKTGPLSITTSR